jgi:ABC-type bacteriocin/lantibiotic exporter with double-glycine peptidase domain
MGVDDCFPAGGIGIRFPTLQQSYHHDCGPETGRGTLLYYGIPKKLGEIADIVGTTVEGTPPEGLLRLYEQHGLQHDFRQMSVEDVIDYLRRDVPVTLLLQAWGNPRPASYKEVWDCGHYVVPTRFLGVNGNAVMHFADPYAPTRRVELSVKELLERWHDMDENGKTYLQHGIAVYGKEPCPDWRRCAPMG